MQDKSSTSSQANPSRPTTVRTTFGEILKDGTVIEPVAVDGRLTLCTYDGSEAKVRPFYECENVVYTPPPVDPGLYAALRFPPPPVECESLAHLFTEAVKVFERWGYAPKLGQSCAIVSTTSWLQEGVYEPLTAVAFGADMQEAAILFSLHACICRRPLRVTQLSQALPFALRPTAFILAPDSSVKSAAFWRAANMRGFTVPIPKGKFSTLTGVRVLFARDEPTLSSWGENALRLPLLLSSHLTPPTEQELDEIANYFQPRFLMWRLRCLWNMNRSSEAPRVPRRFGQDRTFRQLYLLMREAPEVARAAEPIIEERRTESLERQAVDPACVLVELLWGRAHTNKKMQLAELVNRLNAVLRRRGEPLVFNAREVGWKLTQLGLPRRRTKKGRFISFSLEVRRQLHWLRRTLHLDLPAFNCPECKTI